MSNFCGNCGTKFEEGVLFCPNCGKPSDKEKQNVAQNSNFSKRKKVIFIGSIMVSVILAAVIIIFAMGSRASSGYKAAAKKYAVASYSFNLEEAKLYMAMNYNEVADSLVEYYSDLVGKTEQAFLEEISRQFNTTISDSEGLLEYIYEYPRVRVEEKYGTYNVSTKITKSEKLVQEEMDSLIEKYNSNDYYDIKDYIDAEAISKAYSVEMEVFIDGDNKEETLNTTYFMVEYKGDWKVLLEDGEKLSLRFSKMIQMLIQNMLAKEDEEILTEEVNGYTNIAILGGDSRSGDILGQQNIDTIIIASINNNTKEVKLVSVYRDTIVNTGKNISKCNNAYLNGGTKSMINTLNMNLDLDITKFVMVDFGALVEVVDLLGGIELEVSEAEMKAVNNYIDETGMVANLYIQKNGKGEEKAVNKLTKSGLQMLDGIQVTTYARIRKGVGDDFARTERNRLIIEKLLEKAKTVDVGTISKIVDIVLPNIATNLEMKEIMSYVSECSKYKIVDTTGFPFKKGSGTFPGKGNCVYPITLESNVSLLHEFLYEKENYKPSKKVIEISKEIDKIAGGK